MRVSSISRTKVYFVPEVIGGRKGTALEGFASEKIGMNILLEGNSQYKNCFKDNLNKKRKIIQFVNFFD